MLEAIAKCVLIKSIYEIKGMHWDVRVDLSDFDSVRLAKHQQTAKP